MKLTKSTLFVGSVLMIALVAPALANARDGNLHRANGVLDLSGREEAQLVARGVMPRQYGRGWAPRRVLRGGTAEWSAGRRGLRRGRAPVSAEAVGGHLRATPSPLRWAPGRYRWERNKASLLGTGTAQSP